VEVRVIDTALDPLAEVSAYQQAHNELTGHFGATSIFVGTMRDQNQGEIVKTMSLEHYAGMTEKYLTRISEEAAARWDSMGSLVVHRVGTMLPNDAIVVVAVWSAHRDDAYQASRYIIDELKTRAPFWKKETVEESERWVQPDPD